jgi:phosphoribosyl-dephospho-CoA transferase
VHALPEEVIVQVRLGKVFKDFHVLIMLIDRIVRHVLRVCMICARSSSVCSGVRRAAVYKVV